MPDEATRKLERAAQTGDLEAQARLEQQRCRDGNCCAHAQDPRRALHPTAMPAMPKEARPCQVMSAESGGREVIDYDDGQPTIQQQLTLTLVGSSHAMAAAATWFHQVFPRMMLPMLPQGAMTLGECFYGSTRATWVHVVEVRCVCGAEPNLEPEAPYACDRCGDSGILLYRSDRLPREPRP